MKPFHNHDCNSCIYLGSTLEKDHNGHEKLDFYFCPRCDEGTLISRYGECGDYTSWPLDMYLSRREEIIKNRANYSIEKAYEAYLKYKESKANV